MKQGAQKSKGNRFEHKMSKKLGNWMFGDQYMLDKDPTSGARKLIYKGDIVPVKAHEFNWSCWPFLFECKDGYKNNIPTLMNQSLVREWLYKLLSELDQTSQFIPMLIAQFHGYKTPILLTTLVLNFYTDISMLVAYENEYYQFYIYNFNEIIKSNFYEVLPDDVKQLLYSRKDDKKVFEPKKNKGLTPKTKYDEGIGEYLDQILK